MQFPTEKYEIILADPPWKYDIPQTHNKGKGTGGACTHYGVMNLEQLKALPVKDIRANNCLLFMWTTGPQMHKAVALGEAWGFKYKTCVFVWEKQTKMVGHYSLSSCEFVLLFRRGNIPKPRGSRNELQFLSEKRTKRHSEKPDTIRQRITSMFPT